MQTAVILIGTLGWWGFVYPELSAVTESASFAARLIKDLGNTGIKSGNVRIKSRIMEYLYQRKEKETTEKESGYDRQECAHRGV